MKVGDIIRHNGWIGVITNKLPNDRMDCMFGNETKRFSMPIFPRLLTPVEIISMTPGEHEDVLHLMQALVFTLVENNEPF